MEIMEISRNIQQDLFKQPLPQGWESWIQEKYLLGLDNGGGNNSCALVDRDAVNAGDFAFCMLRDEVGKDSLYSILAYDQDEETEYVLIDEAAVMKPHVFQNFKKAPTAANLDAQVDGVARRKLYTDYIRTLFETLTDNAGKPILSSLGPENMIITVGVPSSTVWNEEATKENLREIVRKATGCRDVFVVPESRAAIFYAHQSWKDLRGKNILILDLGAFSIDYTFISPHMHGDPPEDSMNLGGHEIETCLLERLQKKAQDTMNAPALNAAQRSRTLFNLRLVKESLYRRLRGGEDNPGTTLPWLTLPELSGLEVTGEDLTDVFEKDGFIVPDPTVLGANAPKSWAQHLRHFLEKADNTLQGQQIDRVIVTGGAANMTHAQALIRDFFARDTRPEHRLTGEQIQFPTGDRYTNESVSAGCVIFMYTALRALQALPQLQETIGTEIREKIFPPLAGSIAKKITEQLFDGGVMEKVTQQWVDKDGTGSTNELGNMLLEAIQTEEMQQKLQDAIQSAAEDLGTVESFKAAENYFNEYFSAENPVREQMKSVNVNASITHSIYQLVASETRQILRDSTITDFGSVLLWLITGLIKWILQKLKILNGQPDPYKHHNKLERMAIRRNILHDNNRNVNFTKPMEKKILISLNEKMDVDKLACDVIETLCEPIKQMIYCE